MRKLFLFTIILLAILIITPQAAFSAEEIGIRITKKPQSSVTIPIAITELINLGVSDKGLEHKMNKKSEHLSNSLKSTGLFEILDPIMFLEDPNKAAIRLNSIDFDDWTIIGAVGLIKGGYRLKDNGMIELEMRYFDTYSKEMKIGKKYSGSKDKVTRMLNRFANEILLEFTGKRGIFGSMIAYVQVVDDYKEIFVMYYDGTAKQRVSRDFSISLSPAWSPDGEKISYTSYKYGNPDLMVSDFIQRKVYRLSKRKGLNLGAEWSPSGEKVALMLSKGNNSDIYIIDSNSGKSLERLTNYWGIDVSPTWSPDGKKLAFTSDRSGNPNIYVMDIDEKTPKRITFDAKYNSSPSWSPLGDKIAFCGQSRNGKFNIFTINKDGTGLQQLTASSRDNENPSWSPDGRYITFASNRAGNYNIYVMNSDGTGIKQLTSLKTDATAPTWSPRLE